MLCRAASPPGRRGRSGNIAPGGPPVRGGPQKDDSRCRVTRSGPPPSTARARKTRRARNCSPSSSARWRWPRARAASDLTANAGLRTMYQKARDALGAPRHHRTGDQARHRRARRGALRGCQLRGLRPRWGRRHRRDPDRQPQPHGSEIRNLFNRNGGSMAEPGASAGSSSERASSPCRRSSTRTPSPRPRRSGSRGPERRG